MKPKIAIVRGKFLNQYDMQSYEILTEKYDLTAFGSLTAFHSRFSFPTVKLLSPLDLPEFPYKMQVLNRLFKDSQYLFGLETALQGYDIAHSSETYFHFTKQCIEAKEKGYIKKVVITVWENIPFNNEGIWGRKEMKHYAISRADHFIAVSERAKKSLLLEGAEEKRISVVNPGIDTTVFTPRLHILNKSKDIHILFVGRLVENKGVYELLYALHSLKNDKKLSSYNILLTIVGTGSEKERIKMTGKKLGILDIIRFIKASYSDIPDIYRAADIFVAPSKENTYWQEQWGMALMEAQASGLPIVTTQSGSIPENVGDAALLVQPGDVISLSNAMKQFIMDQKLRSEYAKRARKRAITKHDIHIVAQKIGKVYEKVLRQ